LLALSELTVAYADWRASFSLTVPKGAMCALIGPSGGGKTTLLNLIAGFVAPSSGTLTFDDQDLLPLGPSERPLSMLFQEHNLFPHLTAAENVGLGIDPGLRLSHSQRAEIETALARVELSGHFEVLRGFCQLENALAHPAGRAVDRYLDHAYSLIFNP